MTGFVAFCLFFCAICVPSRGDAILGPGVWNVINIRKYPGQSNSLFDCDINIRKINRTHSGFNINLKLNMKLDKFISVRLDVCKRMDGGCKPYLVLADNNFEHFIDMYAKENAKQFFILAKIDPPNFPMEPGEYKIRDYIFDLDELPINSLYGEFIAKACVLKNFFQVAGCIEIVVDHTVAE